MVDRSLEGERTENSEKERKKGKLREGKGGEIKAYGAEEGVL